MAQDDEDNHDLMVEFSVNISESSDDPADLLGQDIQGIIKIFDETHPDGERPIGFLKAYLFHVSGIINSGVNILEPYDIREQHLADTINRLFDFDRYEFRPNVVKKLNFDFSDYIEWHLHAFMLYLEPEFRGKRRGNRVLRLLRLYAQRPGLLATARAFPEKPDQRGKKPSGREMANLARYYLSDKNLGFKQLGRLDQGWLMANWSP